MYRDKFVEIGVANTSGKSWVYVKLLPPHRGYLVSFRQLFEQVQLIVECEKAKYPRDTLPHNRDAGVLVRQFFVYAASEGANWDHAAKYFQLPPQEHIS